MKSVAQFILLTAAACFTMNCIYAKKSAQAMPAPSSQKAEDGSVQAPQVQQSGDTVLSYIKQVAGDTKTGPIAVVGLICVALYLSPSPLHKKVTAIHEVVNRIDRALDLLERVLNAKGGVPP
jgi:hypothetical protein